MGKRLRFYLHVPLYLLVFSHGMIHQWLFFRVCSLWVLLLRPKALPARGISAAREQVENIGSTKGLLELASSALAVQMSTQGRIPRA
jgi:hypothetical protein